MQTELLINTWVSNFLFNATVFVITKIHDQCGLLTYNYLLQIT